MAMTREYPRIRLAMDSCVLYKRRTTPGAWAPVIKGLGVNCVEADADTELGPLYMEEACLADWEAAVRTAGRPDTVPEDIRNNPQLSAGRRRDARVCPSRRRGDRPRRRGPACAEGFM